MQHLLSRYRLKCRINHQVRLKKRYKEYYYAKEHPSKIAVWSMRSNKIMSRWVSKMIHCSIWSNKESISISYLLRQWIQYVISSKYYLFICITFLLLFLPIPWKEAVALTNSDWPLNICGIAFFIHTNLLEWIFNVVAAGILMPLNTYLFKKIFGQSKSNFLWILFLLGGYISNLIMCSIFSIQHLKYSVVGSSGGCCILLGVFIILYAYCLYKDYRYHKILLHHKILLFAMFALLYECYLDSSSLSSLTLNPALIVHRIGTILGALSIIIICIYRKIFNNSKTKSIK